MRFRALCLVLGLICVGSACRKTNSPNPDTSTPDGPGGTTGGNGSAPTSFTSEQLHKMFKDDSRGFDAKYKGKPVEVTGKVRDLSQWSDKKSGHVQLVGDPQVRFDSLGCLTTDPEPWKTVLPGQTVTLVGTFESIAGLAPMVRASKITRVEGERPVPVDVAKLGADLRANRAVVAERYRSTVPQPMANACSLMFVGKFAGTGTLPITNEPTWLLEGPEGVKLQLKFSSLLANPPTAPGAGRELTFVATCWPSGTDLAIEFQDALIVSVK